MRRIETWQLRTRFAQALSAMYGGEVPAYPALTAEARRIAAATGLPWQEAAESVWPQYFPATDAGLAADELAYYRHSYPSQPIVYEDFLPRSAAGIFRSNLDSDAVAGGNPATPTTTSTG
jgi:uncharacterized glyoxalase superfamily metalloenzyme YdcJ